MPGLRFPVHDVVIHVISVSYREIPFTEFSHSHMFVKLQCLVVAVYIQFHQTRTGMHFLDVLDGFSKEETAAMCTLVIGEHINLLQVE